MADYELKPKLNLSEGQFPEPQPQCSQSASQSAGQFAPSNLDSKVEQLSETAISIRNAEMKAMNLPDLSLNPIVSVSKQLNGKLNSETGQLRSLILNQSNSQELDEAGSIFDRFITWISKLLKMIDQAVFGASKKTSARVNPVVKMILEKDKEEKERARKQREKENARAVKIS